MTTESINESKENELLAKLQLHEDKKFSDRANFLLAAQGLLFNAFATLIADLKLTGYHLWIPITICVAAILLNVFWGVTNKFQINKTIEPLRKLTESRKLSSSLKNYFEIAGKKNALTLNDIYKWAPILLAIAWGFILAFYVLQITIGITI